ncbi:NADPH oxidase activator 1-like [Clytia hemisphaerica]|uniref:Uncharacterized protein n=1 Tax=Clytia hemisphaerica TaxID=252671 RepID=A0A7M5V6I3_9CNID|eukprot:TCONS_00013867-protein
MELLKNMGKKTSTATNEIAKPTTSMAKQMSSADDIAAWYEGVQLYDINRIDEALEVFKNTKQNAKMLLNIGCCYLRKNDLQSASENYEKAVKSDPHSALGFFFLGLTNYFQDKYRDALSNFQKSQELLRGNKFVDYRQLGFKFQLYSCEIYTNEAATHHHLGNDESAQASLKQALEMKADKRHERIMVDIQKIAKGKPIQLFYPPQSEIFRPAKALVANVEKKDYLGASKVISTDSEEDCYACFSGIKDKVIEQKKEEQRRKSSAVPPSGLDQIDGGIKQRRLTPSATFDAGSRKSSLTPNSRQVSFESNSSISPSGTPQRRRSSAKPMPMMPLPVCPGTPPASEERKLSQTESFVQREGLGRERKASVKPEKPLPKLSRDEPVIEEVALMSPVSHVEVQPAFDLTDSGPHSDEVEVILKYCFTRKIRLTSGFTMNDLQANVSRQQLPRQFEFRTEDDIGRQSTLNSSSLNTVSQGSVILCYPSE